MEKQKTTDKLTYAVLANLFLAGVLLGILYYFFSLSVVILFMFPLLILERIIAPTPSIFSAFKDKHIFIVISIALLFLGFDIGYYIAHYL